MLFAKHRLGEMSDSNSFMAVVWVCENGVG